MGKLHLLKNSRPETKNKVITFSIVIALFLFSMIWIEGGFSSSQFAGLMVPICYYVILAVSLNLTVGILGELSLGHAGFMCIGAYAGSVTSLYLQDAIPQALIRFPIAVLIGGVVAAIFGVLIGIPILRLKGDYLAIVTLAFGEIIKSVANNIKISIPALNSENMVVINGPQGITGTPKDSTFINAFILLIITLIVILNFIDSRSGRAVKAIRDNRIAAETTGLNVTRYKLIAFALSAFFAGVAGVLYSHNINNLSATTKNFGYTQSIMILVMVVLGGIGSIRGSIIAAIFLTLIPELLRGLQDYRMLIYSIILIIAMLLNSSSKFAALKEKYGPKSLIKKLFKKKEVQE